jgi:hypothetical protein
MVTEAAATDMMAAAVTSVSVFINGSLRVVSVEPGIGE